MKTIENKPAPATPTPAEPKYICPWCGPADHDSYTCRYRAPREFSIPGYYGPTPPRREGC